MINYAANIHIIHRIFAVINIFFHRKSLMPLSIDCIISDGQAQRQPICNTTSILFIKHLQCVKRIQNLIEQK